MYFRSFPWAINSRHKDWRRERDKFIESNVFWDSSTWQTIPTTIDNKTVPSEYDLSCHAYIAACYFQKINVWLGKNIHLNYHLHSNLQFPSPKFINTNLKCIKKCCIHITIKKNCYGTNELEKKIWVNEFLLEANTSFFIFVEQFLTELNLHKFAITRRYAFYELGLKFVRFIDIVKVERVKRFYKSKCGTNYPDTINVK